MRNRLILSLLIGLALSGVGLIKSSGLTPPMVPCAGVGPGCVAGLIFNHPAQSIEVEGNRGFPFAILYLQSDSDGNYKYEGYSVAGILGDWAIYSLVVFGIIFAYKKLAKNS